MSHNPVYDITSFTALDFPDHLAAIIWFAKCNMRCVYCYNTDIVFAEGTRSEEDVLDFLQSRQGLLEAVVLSGGEATLYKDLEGFCRKIKSLGFKIKLDTNGLNPKKVKTLVEEGLLDYIALDYKAPEAKYTAITQNRQFSQFKMTLQYLIDKAFAFEVRTTVHTSLLQEEDINEIIDDLVNCGYRGTYYLQAFVEAENTIGSIGRETFVLDPAKLSTSLPLCWR